MAFGQKEISEEFCHRLAKDDINLILAGKNYLKLEKLQNTLEKEYNIETMIFQHDFEKVNNLKDSE